MLGMRHTGEVTEITLLFFIYSYNVHEVAIPIASYFHFYSETVIYKFIDSKYRIWMIHTWLRWISDVSDDFLYIFVHFFKFVGKLQI